MATVGPRTDSSSSNLQLLYRKPRKRSRHCCSRCCTCCVQALSGFIFLLAVAAVVFVARYFLEFPSIKNGYLTPDFTIKNTTVLNASNVLSVTDASVTVQPTTATAKMCTTCSASSGNVPGITTPEQSLTSIPGLSTQVVARIECQLFLGSFHMLDENYKPEYNDSTSQPFQLKAKKVQSMMDAVFTKSSLNESYKNSSMFAISQHPFTVHIQLCFCSSSTHAAQLSSTAVAQSLVSSSQGPQGGATENINAIGSIAQEAANRINASSIIVQDDGSCLSGPLMFDVEAEWPWQASILQNGSHVCMGILISGSWVLSVASCVTPSVPAWYSVQLGVPSCSSNVAHLDQIIVHPLHITSLEANNVALIHLKKTVLFGSRVLPICLPPLDQLAPRAHTTCQAAAWSVPDGNARIFKQAEGTVALSQSCSNLSQDQSICWTPSDLGEIQIDMGASITCSNTTETLHLTGFSPVLQSSKVKNPNFAFVMVQPFVNWIQGYTAA